MILLTCLLSIPNALIADLEGIEKQFRETVHLRVIATHIAEVADLNKNYLAALERSLERAKEEKNLEEAVALRDEFSRVKIGEALAEMNGEDTPTAKGLREIYQKQLADLAAKRDLAAAPIVTSFSAALLQYQEDLTSAGKLEEAMKIKEYRMGDLAVKLLGATAQTTKEESVSSEALFLDALLYLPADRPAEGRLAGNVRLHGEPELAASPRGSGFLLDGIDDYLDIGELRLPNQWTVSFWGRLDRVVPYHKFFSFKNGEKKDQVEAQVWGDGTGTFKFWINKGPTISIDPTVGDWRHYAWQVGNGKTALYIDGKLVKTIDSIRPIPDVPRKFCFLGAGANDDGQPENAGFLKGAIDEFLLFDRILTPEELNILANADE